METSQRFVTFREPWGKRSWLVDYDGPYENDRKSHVELGESNMKSVQSGQRANITDLRRERNAILWTVEDVHHQNKRLAHFTVAFGRSFAKRNLEDFK